jgi:hypothetical protein
MTKLEKIGAGIFFCSFAVLLFCFFYQIISLMQMEHKYDTAYKEKLAIAHAHCNTVGGDEFLPYGFTSWYQIIKLDNPRNAKCVKLGKYFKRNLAVYAFKQTSTGYELEIK